MITHIQTEVLDYIDWRDSLSPTERIRRINATLRRHAQLLAPKPKPVFRKGDQTPIILAWLKAQAEPQLVEQIAAATGVNIATVRSVLAQRGAFEESGKVKRGKVLLKLWRVG